ncbi:tRNA dihydrouridine synthase DusB [Demequina sp. B12]|uniref:tRNA dihydrouridine synthase DusB n=1 Tax=Demequina sp. B12 TaxID=2992757 RepID=UPI00237A2D5A|nr:tRNA dihydrouridine synthase DusB [Demequina sp. B12]MDE0572872.1 tRNA dihydrouridine synthase DusB [Demequina sp. B12]
MTSDASAQPASGERVLPPLRIGPLTIDTPVVLAPMAGITNAAFRRLCREYGGGIYVAEMVTSRALVERTPESLRIIHHDPDETPRSVQLYGVDPATIGAAVKMLVTEDRADHIDMNFGCPVPKVTKKGGGAVLPWKKDLFRDIVRAAVREAAPYDIPVTVKMRKGVDEDHLTYIEAGRMAESEGVAAVALHGRTAADYYSGHADWEAIARLKEAVKSIPVLGNGDIWAAEDALDMVARTGVDGVVVGRGCQGRPWLFADLQAAFEGRDDRVKPGLRMVADTIYRHGELMVPFFGGDELKAMREIRKHVAWYLKGYPVGGEIRKNLGLVETLPQLRALLDSLPLDTEYPGADAEGPRGRQGTSRTPSCPDGWLDTQDITPDLEIRLREAELSVSGG